MSSSRLGVAQKCTTDSPSHLIAVAEVFPGTNISGTYRDEHICFRNLIQQVPIPHGSSIAIRAIRIRQ